MPRYYDKSELLEPIKALIKPLEAFCELHKLPMVFGIQLKETPVGGGVVHSSMNADGPEEAALMWGTNPRILAAMLCLDQDTKDLLVDALKARCYQSNKIVMDEEYPEQPENVCKPTPD